MIQVRKSKDRGYFDHGWLKTYHTFSFSDYYDAKFMGFRDLRVINEDFVQADDGFGTHPHNDMEIVTYVLEGTLEHKDSMGNGSLIRPGEVQYMCAGTGVTHSEFNPSKNEAVHLLQIWILPDRRQHAPRYDQKSFNQELDKGSLTLVASPNGDADSIAIHQDVKLFVARLKEGQKISYSVEPKRHLWIQVARGNLQLNDSELSQGDGAAVSDESQISLQAKGASEILLFDLI